MALQKRTLLPLRKSLCKGITSTDGMDFAQAAAVNRLALEPGYSTLQPSRLKFLADCKAMREFESYRNTLPANMRAAEMSAWKTLYQRKISHSMLLALFRVLRSKGVILPFMCLTLSTPAQIAEIEQEAFQTVSQGLQSFTDLSDAIAQGLAFLFPHQKWPKDSKEVQTILQTVHLKLAADLEAVAVDEERQAVVKEIWDKLFPPGDEEKRSA